MNGTFSTSHGSRVTLPGDAYAPRRNGAVVVNAQAQPVARGWVGLALTSIMTNAVQQLIKRQPQSQPRSRSFVAGRRSRLEIDSCT